MEELNLTTPVSKYRVARLLLDWEGQGIQIGLYENGIFQTFGYFGAEATQLMTALNKADLSVKSLHRRILEKLIADGKISGTISGAPD